MKELDNFYLQQDEPIKSCMLALREIIISQDANITTVLKYGAPFFCYRGKMFCYLWLHKKLKQPYIGFVEGKHLQHPELITGTRSRMKIMLFDPSKDLPLRKLKNILRQAIDLYKSGIVKVSE